MGHGTLVEDGLGNRLTIPLAASMGDAAGTNPAAVAGSATWPGVMMGADMGAETRPRQIGEDANLVICELANPSVGVAFAGIGDLGARGARDDMTWSAIPLAVGRFAAGTAGDSIQGVFERPPAEPGATGDRTGGVGSGIDGARRPRGSRAAPEQRRPGAGRRAGAVISHRHRRICVKVPRCASTSVLAWFAAHGGGRPSFRPAWHGGPMAQRLPDTARAMNLYPDCFTFTFQRNPWERFVSAWLHLRRVERERRGGGGGACDALAGARCGAGAR